MKRSAGNAPPAVTPIAFVKAITDAYVLYGTSPERALAAARIAPHLIDDPQARVTAEQFEELSGFAMRELDDEALGWFSRRLPWGSHGLLCRAAITAPDLGVALKRWCRCHGLLTEDIRLHVTVKAGEASVAIEELRVRAQLREFCLVSVLRMVHGFACWLIDSRIPLDALRFPFPRPPHARAYRAMFPGEAQFEAPAAGFSFDAEYLALAPVRDEAATRAMLQKALLLTVLQYRRDRLLVDRVKSLLKSHMRPPAQPQPGYRSSSNPSSARPSSAHSSASPPPASHPPAARATGLPNADVLAEALHISSRTLHRQLREEGASLQQIKDEVRREQALELMRRTSRPLKQIAHLAGFRSEKSFSRAFRVWTGIAPGAFRRE